MKITRVLFGKAKDVCYALDGVIVAGIVEGDLYVATAEEPTRPFTRALDKLIAKAKHRDGVGEVTVLPGTVDTTGTEIVINYSTQT